MQAVLEAARPLADALYDLMREAGGDATPEQRAAFRARLDQAARRIPDKALADEYREVLRGRFYAARRRKPGRPNGRPRRGTGSHGRSAATRRRRPWSSSGPAS